MGSHSDSCVRGCGLTQTGISEGGVSLFDRVNCIHILISHSISVSTKKKKKERKKQCIGLKGGGGRERERVGQGSGPPQGILG